MAFLIYKIVISDRSFNIIDEIQDIASNISWEYNRIGGCGAFSFNVPEKYCKETTLGANFNVKISRKNLSTNAYELWYQGRIEDKIINVRGLTETISIRGMGYQSALSDIYVDRDYSNTEISAIVTDILDNDIVPNTNVSYSGGDITSTTFTPDSLSFNTSALNAFQTLSDLFGTREWGVDVNRKFFFKARSSSVGFRFPLGQNVISFSEDSSSKSIINRVIVNGDGGFQRIVNDLPSQNKFKRHDKVIQNTAITTNGPADQLGNAILTEFKDVVRRATLELLDEQLIETTIPIPLVEMRPDLITWGEFKWGTFLWSGLINYQVNRILYKINKEGSLTINMQLGQLRPDIAENINLIEFKLDQLRQVGV